MDVDDAVAEPFQERGGQNLHVAGEHDEVDIVRREPLGKARITFFTARVVGRREDACVNACVARALERADAGLVRRDACDRESRVDEGLEIRSLAADEDADHESSPITSDSVGASSTTAHMPMPAWNTRRSSSSSTPRSPSQS